jgi:thymidylate synthase (FAD)
MKVLEPKVEILTPINYKEIFKHIETVGRVCYKSEDKIIEGSSEKFIAMIIKNGHEAVIEHFNITMKFTTDRGISHEIVRHRVASYAQESTRYCNYSNDKFSNEITVIKPIDLQKYSIDEIYSKEYIEWFNACKASEDSYFYLLKHGVEPQTARSILPTCLKTELMMTMNLREIRHFLKLRTSKASHPDMRYLAINLLRQLQELIPVIFDDIQVEVEQ